MMVSLLVVLLIEFVIVECYRPGNYGPDQTPSQFEVASRTMSVLPKTRPVMVFRWFLVIIFSVGGLRQQTIKAPLLRLILFAVVWRQI